MGTTTYFLVTLCALIFVQILLFEFSFSDDTISSVHSLKDGDTETTLVSSGQIFELGFFSPINSKNRYVGIWYKITPDVVVWVANRNKPLNDSFGEFTINDKGNLVLLDRAKSVIWSSNSSRVAENPVVQILDTGNLVLRERESTSSESYLWQSFDYPTDTILPGMKIGWDLRTGFERYNTAWKSVSDPSDGNFSARMDIRGLPQLIIAEGSTRKIRIGPWNGVEMIGFTVGTYGAYKRLFVFNENESYYTVVPSKNSLLSRITLSTTGKPDRFTLLSGSHKWTALDSLPYDSCDNYGYCGPNGICRANGDPICQCLRGFAPSSQEEWELPIWSSGCVRNKSLGCDKGDGFVKLRGVKLPDLLHFWLDKGMSLKECKAECLKNCSCVAYANSDITKGGSGCLIWFGELIDIRELRVKGKAQNMYVRLSASEIKSIAYQSKRRSLKIKLAASISSGIFVLLFCCITWNLRKMAKDKRKDDDIGLPLFDLATIQNATIRFSNENLIGEGGFGPVYRGTLPNGQEIAVKRLSKNSKQGSIEFKNEVELIAKLQHKNLVALLGCCIRGDERMLIYEYMPNKSLDNYIFDKKRSNLSSWEKNFEILMGIARGLLYLHQDSKLPIIHRDLKASNVLLDGNMNPKISDFGLARIFGGDQKENRTDTIVGTYGYISPEFAVDGIFSFKSDIFSFGVLLLEIVSGKKNRKFRHHDHHHNLLGHAWLLWNKGEALELMDLCFKNSGVESQVLRCIHVGLLCVQKHSEDRPTMNSVFLMLSNEEVKLPPPKEPGFFVERSANNNNESSTSRTDDSENTMTFTIYGR